MTRAALCGGPELVAAAAVLGLVDGEPAQLALVDMRSAEGVARAAALPAAIPRVLLADPEGERLLRAAGAPYVTSLATPEALGPLVTGALPPARRGATRRVVLTAARGGVGRTLLAVNLARRVSGRCPLWLLDATGTGAAAWWLRAEVRPWSDFEPLAHELSLEHLRIVAAEPSPGLRLLGGGGPAPSVELLAACLARLDDAEELAVIDAPLLADERTGALVAGSGIDARTLVVSYADPASLAALDCHDLGQAWLIASQDKGLPGRSVFRALPRDEAAVSAAHGSRAAVSGALGRAYDDLAELIAIDAS